MATLLQTSHLTRTIPRLRIATRLPRPVAFWTVAVMTAALLAASSAPSPLYPVYQAEFGFSSITLTAIFAVYVLALLLALLTVGRLSDFLGRRPVLVVALLVEAGAMAVFLDAHSVTALYEARLVQGLATGAAVGVVGAYLLDLQPTNGSRLGSLVNSAAATGGLGLGAVLSGVLLQYGPSPTRLVYGILTATFVLLALVTFLLPESVTKQPGALAAMRPQVKVPRPARSAFIGAVPIIASTWMLGGLMFSVGGSLLTAVFGQHNHAVVGLVLGVFALAAATMSVLLRNHTPQQVERIGGTLLTVGSSLLVIGLATTSLTTFVIGAVVAGSGFGPSFLGAFRTVSQLAQPHERAALISAIYVVSYLTFSIPALIAGLVITDAGLRPTALVYGGVVALVAAVTLATKTRASHGRERALRSATVVES
jgi:MFS family permease